MDFENINYDDDTFFYDGTKYMIYAALQYKKGEEWASISLTNSNIKDLEIETRAGQLYSQGFLIYDDIEGDISKVLGKFELELMVDFHSYENYGDGFISFDLPDTENQLMHWFTVDNVEILQTKEKTNSGKIKYCIYFTGVEHKQLLNHVVYSDFENNDSKSVVQIIRDILNINGKFKTDESFSTVQSGVLMKYISNGNDTVQTSVDYLLQKQMFFGSTFDSGMKILTYDPFEGKIGIFQLGFSKSEQTYNVVFSTNRSQISEFISSNDISLQSDSTMRKSDIFPAISNIIIRSFDLETNGFNERTVTSGQIVRFFGGNQDHCMLFPMTDGTETYMVREYSDWDNGSSIYKDLLNTFLGWDSVIVETGGIIGRKLMEMVNISIDNMVETPMQTTTAQAKENSERHNRMQGLWYITGITHVIKPADGKYTQKMHLSRVD